MNSSLLVHKKSRTTIVTIAFLILLVGFLARFIHSAFFTTRDFSAFWIAGKALNLGLDPYSALSKIPLPIELTGHTMDFVSPIFLAELMRLFAFMPFHIAKLIWLVISLILMILSLLIIMEISNIPRSYFSLMIGVMSLISFNPIIFIFDNGQTDMVVVFSLLLSWMLMRRKKLFLSGLVLCVSFINPHLVLGVVVYYIYRIVTRRETALLMGLAVGGICLIIVSLPYTHYVFEWIRTILPDKQQWALTASGQITWLNLLHELLGPYKTYAKGLVGIIDIGALLLSIRSWHSSKGRELDLDFGIAITLGLVTTTFAFNQDYSVLILIFPIIVRLRKMQISENIVAFLVLCNSFLYSGITGFLTPLHQLLLEVTAPIILVLALLFTTQGDRSEKQRKFAWAFVWLFLTLGGYAISLEFRSIIVQQVLVLVGLLSFMSALCRSYPSDNGSLQKPLEKLVRPNTI
ncbi:glycosyltransferase family 87 protein [Alicyclobacillus ferrooxydans]|uniref:Glycosyltransferase RgtA/B/C/D-like domain-containing protein n=1 Tax=Alicyclobacillus ferrooxydans TaxID=471514 RepID=A0A0P9C3J9_9BACL|nr:glycosyltransferase family 87 protein [Alicyclobacillus ferrooxydans]KPV39306.1 hypothetical protein AN477_22675 [Alicyclobacillus ferrooxydans]